MINTELRHTVHVTNSENKMLKEILASCQEKLALHEVGFISRQEELTACHEELTTCQEELALSEQGLTACEEELALCEQGLISCQEELTICQEQLYLTHQTYQENIVICQEKLADAEVSSATVVQRYRNKLLAEQARMRSLQSSMDSSDDPFTAADTLIRSLCAKNVEDREIVNGFMLALKSKSEKFRKHIISFLTSQENHIKEIADYYGDKRYYELQEKFKPCVCLHELDFVATVSFHGYEVIQ